MGHEGRVREPGPARHVERRSGIDLLEREHVDLEGANEPGDGLDPRGVARREALDVEAGDAEHAHALGNDVRPDTISRRACMTER
jgi:hypothetical protein